MHGPASAVTRDLLVANLGLAASSTVGISEGTGRGPTSLRLQEPKRSPVTRCAALLQALPACRPCRGAATGLDACVAAGRATMRSRLVGNARLLHPRGVAEVGRGQDGVVVATGDRAPVAIDTRQSVNIRPSQPCAGTPWNRERCPRPADDVSRARHPGRVTLPLVQQPFLTGMTCFGPLAVIRATVPTHSRGAARAEGR